MSKQDQAVPRRSWRDLDRREPPRSPAAQPVPARELPRGPGDLDAAAALLPDSRLGALMEERRALEARLRNFTGLPGQQGSGDAARDARFRVPTFAERQAELRQWEAQRQSRSSRPAEAAWQGSDRWAGAGRPAQDEAASLPVPATGLGATGLSDRLRALRSGIGGRSRGARDSLLARPRAVAERIDEVGSPLRQTAEQLAGQRRQLDEMDRRLAAEGVSADEREEIREAVRVDAIDKVSGVLGRASEALEAPRKAVARIEQFWQRRERQISGPMDRFSGYAANRERRLSTETGGSGDLFERMEANRRNALRRRRESRLQERSDERRRERAAQRRAEGS